MASPTSHAASRALDARSRRATVVAEEVTAPLASGWVPVAVCALPSGPLGTSAALAEPPGRGVIPAALRRSVGQRNRHDRDQLTIAASTLQALRRSASPPAVDDTADTRNVPSVLRLVGSQDDPLGGQPAPSPVLDALRSSRSGSGQPLPESIGGRLAAQFGRDFSAVRVHADAQSDAAARSVQAVAFTHGRDLYFSSGSYAPGSPSGQRLLAHELAHVSEAEAGGSVADTTTIGRANDPVEIAADRAADAAMAGLTSGRGARFPGPRPEVTEGPVGEPIARTIRRNILKDLGKAIRNWMPGRGKNKQKVPAGAQAIPTHYKNVVPTHYKNVVPTQYKNVTAGTGKPGSGPTAVQSKDDDLLLHQNGPSPSALSQRPKRHRAFLERGMNSDYNGETAAMNPKLKGSIHGEWAEVAGLKKCLAALRAGAVPKQAADQFLGQSALRITLAAIEPQDVDDAIQVVQSAIDTWVELARLQEVPLEDTGEVGDLTGRKVHYDSQEEQKQSSVSVSGGKLYRSTGELVDTSGSSTFFSGKGAEIFVASTDGYIHMGSHKIGKYHHSSLLAASKVSVGGEMKVTAGKIDWISNKSGHYAPTKDHLVQFLHWLEKDGVTLDFSVQAGWGLPSGKTARELVEGHDQGGPEPKEGFFRVKLRAVIQSYLKKFNAQQIRHFGKSKGWYFDANWEPRLGYGGAAADPKLVIAALKAKFGPADALVSLA